MFQNLFPDEIADSAYIIDYDRLYREGYRGVIYDVDNTLVPHGAPADARAKALFQHFHAIGLQAVFLSNNTEARVRLFAETVGEQYIYLAGKPSPKGYRQAMEMMHTGTENTLFVGDQIFTDIWGARRAGIRAVLVKPVHPKEELQIMIKRKLEKPVLRAYARFHAEQERAAGEGGRTLPTVLLPKNADGSYPQLYGVYDGRPGTMRNMQREAAGADKEAQR